MAKKKIKLTRPELKRQRDALARFKRYLPMLKLKQQQLQLTIRQVAKQRQETLDAYEKALDVYKAYQEVTADLAGVNIKELAAYEEIKTSSRNVAGVNIPVFEDVVFVKPRYSLFATPAWVDRAVLDLQEVNKHKAKLNILQRQFNLLHGELTKIVQRVNLFEKVKIPESLENIRKIRIKLGDEMASAVGRAKIAKTKLTEAQTHGGAEQS